MKDVIDVLELQGQREKINRNPIDYRCLDSSFAGARYLFECGIKVGSKPEVITTAAYIFHKFFKEADVKKYDLYLIASACLYVASKVRDESLRIRDLINVSHNTLHRHSPPLELGDQYWSMRDAIIQAELLIMRMIKFEFSQTDPMKYLTQFYQSLKLWLHPEDCKGASLLQMALALLTDFHHEPSVINYKPEHLAIGSLFLALQCHGISISTAEKDDELCWVAALDNTLTRDKVWEIAERMMDCYDKESSEIS